MNALDCPIAFWRTKEKGNKSALEQEVFAKQMCGQGVPAVLQWAIPSKSAVTGAVLDTTSSCSVLPSINRTFAVDLGKKKKTDMQYID